MMIIVSFSFSFHRVRVGTNFVSMQLVMRFDVDDDRGRDAWGDAAGVDGAEAVARIRR